MVPNKWRDFMRKNRLMPQKEVALVSQYLKIGSCTPATLHQVVILNSTFWFDVGILAIKKLFSSCSPKRIFGIKVLKFTKKTILFKYVGNTVGNFEGAIKIGIRGILGEVVICGIGIN